jgi:hypothetical protein
MSCVTAERAEADALAAFIAQGGAMDKTMGATTGGSSVKAALTAPPGYVPTLPDISGVTSLLDCVRCDLLGALAMYRRLLPQVRGEGEDEEGENVPGVNVWVAQYWSMMMCQKPLARQTCAHQLHTL